jgi:perosamine synthetase
MGGEAFIPVNEPVLGEAEKKYVSECLESGWISSEGPMVGRFEEKFAARMGRKFGVAVCNGSAALDAAVDALEIGPGDEVILPTFTIISCAASVVRAGAVPVVVDCDPKTWNMTADRVRAKITSRTKAIMIVHLYGLPVDLDPILAIAKEKGLRVIEDAAQMHGQTYRGRPCGSFGDASTFSFYPNKQVTTGEGGMVLTDDPALAERLRSVRNLCFDPKRRFVHEKLGWNLRMTSIQAAIGLGQVERLDETVEARRRIGRAYRELLEGIDGIELPEHRTSYAESIYWVNGFVLKDTVPFDADAMMKRLSDLKIGTRPFFWPMHEQPVFRKMGWFAGEKHPVAERLARRGLYLPSGLGISDGEIRRVVDGVRKSLTA